jgi:hypothetical protein
LRLDDLNKHGTCKESVGRPSERAGCVGNELAGIPKGCDEMLAEATPSLLELS